MDTFHIILKIASSPLGMQKFFFVASETHKKFNCTKSLCKVDQFVKELDKILSAYSEYEEIRALFIELCRKSVDIFDTLYRLNLPENGQSTDRIKELTGDITSLREKEAELVRELMNVRKKKGRPKNSNINYLQIFLGNISLASF